MHEFRQQTISKWSIADLPKSRSLAECSGWFVRQYLEDGRLNVFVTITDCTTLRVRCNRPHRLPEYLRTRPTPFYPWLRQMAWENIVQLHRQYLLAPVRAVVRPASRLNTVLRRRTAASS
jgi:hypothetical protein